MKKKFAISIHFTRTTVFYYEYGICLYINVFCRLFYNFSKTDRSKRRNYIYIYMDRLKKYGENFYLPTGYFLFIILCNRRHVHYNIFFSQLLFVNIIFHFIWLFMRLECNLYANKCKWNDTFKKLPRNFKYIKNLKLFKKKVFFSIISRMGDLFIFHSTFFEFSKNWILMSLFN